MIDLNFLRQHPDVAQRKFRERGLKLNLKKLLNIDQDYRQFLQEVETLRAERNKRSRAAAADPAVRSQLKQLKETLTKKESKLDELQRSLHAALEELPNVHADDVPVGSDEAANQVLREVGEKPRLAAAKDYLTIAEHLGIIDVKRAGKVSGARFGYLLGAATELEFALVRYGYDILTKEGFIPVIPPVMIKTENMKAMGYFGGGGESETYRLPEDNLVLVGTSEQSIGPMHRDETFYAEQLPRRYVAFSTCFRREAGSYGKDTKGILRVHQFDKLEMFSFTLPEKSDQEHEFFLSLQEKLWRTLNIPYRIVKMCSGDLGWPSARTYDLEAWMPGQGTYREVGSTSTTTDYQSRDLNISVNRHGEKGLVHTLNGTAFAVGRTLIAIIENYQQADGSVVIPKVLQPFMGKKKIIQKPEV